MMADPTYVTLHVVVLQEGVDSPFIPKSDEEKAEETKDEKKEEDKSANEEVDEGLRIDFEDIDRRTVALPLPTANYGAFCRIPQVFFLGREKTRPVHLAPS